MKQRIISGVIVAAVAIAAIITGGYFFDVLVLLFGCVAIFEFYTAFSKKGYSPVRPAGLFYTALLGVMIFLKSDSLFEIRVNIGKSGDLNIFAPVFLLFVMILLVLIVVKHDDHNIADISVTLFGGFYVTFLISYFVKLRFMDGGIYLFFLALASAVATDTFAFFVGKAIGKRKLIEAISPKKTVAGSIGGFLGSIVIITAYGLVLWFTGAYKGLAVYHYPIIAAVSGIISQFGDLAASAIKRYAGIKDFGKLIPGHGGILDRIDSYLFTIPVVYYYLLFMGVGGV